jgi:hypothetical protein
MRIVNGGVPVDFPPVVAESEYTRLAGQFPALPNDSDSTFMMLLTCFSCRFMVAV